MAATADADNSILLQFDPLNSPSLSPTVHKTPARRRDRDPQSPVAAFFSTVDKSKTLLATVKKKKEKDHQDLIDLGQTPVPPRVDLHFTDSSSVTPLPFGKLNHAHNVSRLTSGPVFDPFSPPAAAPTYQSFPPLDTSKLIPTETPAKTPRADLLVSTIFTPVPSNLPYLPNASLSSLYASSTASTSTTKRRRSSIDLDKEFEQVKSPDSSFDILRGELEIGTSAEVSFVSSTSDKGAEAAVEESPWIMRNTAMSLGGPLSSLTPVKESREASLLAHEIPLPDSPLTSPESSPIRNADASMHASRIFPNSRRYSMAPQPDAVLQFPQESPEAKNGQKLGNHPSSSNRISTAHTRTMSMTSVTSVGSTQSTTTIRNLSPSRAKLAQGTKETVVSNKDRRDTILASKRTPQIPPVSQKNSPSKASAARRTMRPSIALKPTSRVSLIGTTVSGPRQSIIPPPRSTAPRASLAIAARTSAVAASRTSATSGTTSSTLLRGPRPSVATGRASMAPLVTRSKPTQVVAEKEKDTALTAGARANTALRLPRASIAVSTALGGAAKKVGSGISSIVKQPASGLLKARPSIVPPPPSSGTFTGDGEKRRPRTSSAGAALISRPSIGGNMDIGAAQARPSVAGARPTMQRPKSVLNMRA